MADTVADTNANMKPVVKTEGELRKELEELERQQQQINERLRDSSSSRRFGRGGGRGGSLGGGGSNRLGAEHSGSGPPFRPSGGRGGQRGIVRTFEEAGMDEKQPPRKKRLLSAIVKVNKDEDNDSVANGAREGVEEDYHPRHRPGNRFQDYSRNSNSHGIDSDPSEPVPRVLPVTQDPGLARRNRRMFGALLLGTLEKFKEENQKLQGSEAFLRRSHSLQRAEQKRTEASERLREQERKELEDRRRKDLTLRARLAAKAEEKQLELLYLQWASHHERLSTVLRTRSQPSVFFQPAQSCEATDSLLEEQRKELEDWRIQRRAEMQEYYAAVQNEYLANVDKELERWKAGEPSKGLPRLQRPQWNGEGVQGQGHDRRIVPEEEKDEAPVSNEKEVEVDVFEPVLEEVDEVEEGEDVSGVVGEIVETERVNEREPDLQQQELERDEEGKDEEET